MAYTAAYVWQCQEAQRAKESQIFLSGVQAAQERFHLQHGRYAATITVLDLDRPEPTFFEVGPIQTGITGDLRTSWSLTLTRFREAWTNPYTITYGEGGFDASRSTILASLERPRPTLGSLVAWTGR